MSTFFSHPFEMAFGITFGVGLAVLAVLFIAALFGMFDK